MPICTSEGACRFAHVIDENPSSTSIEALTVNGAAAVAFSLDAPSEAPSEAPSGVRHVLGREIAAVDAWRLPAGSHRLPLEVSALAARVHVWRLAEGERVETGRLTVAR